MARMSPEERAQKAMENAAGGWRAFPNTYAAVVAAIRAAEQEAADEAYRNAEDVLQRFLAKQDHRSMTVYDATDAMIAEIRLRAKVRSLTSGGRHG